MLGNFFLFSQSTLVVLNHKRDDQYYQGCVPGERPWTCPPGGQHAKMQLFHVERLAAVGRQPCDVQLIVARTQVAKGDHTSRRSRFPVVVCIPHAIQYATLGGVTEIRHDRLDSDAVAVVWNGLWQQTWGKPWLVPRLDLDNGCSEQGFGLLRGLRAPEKNATVSAEHDPPLRVRHCGIGGKILFKDTVGAVIQ